MTKDCFEPATGTQDRELFIVKGARHIETYFKQPCVDQEAEKLPTFFEKNL